MIATRIDQIRERQEIAPVKMADVALKVDLALVHFLVLPLYKWSNLVPRVSHLVKGE